MNEDNGNIMLVCDPLDGGNVIVVIAVHSRFPDVSLGIPHLLAVYKRQDIYWEEISLEK